MTMTPEEREQSQAKHRVATSEWLHLIVREMLAPESNPYQLTQPEREILSAAEKVASRVMSQEHVSAKELADKDPEFARKLVNIVCCYEEYQQATAAAAS